MHSLRGNKGKRGRMAIKIDLEKAYDRLQWSFIRNTLEEMHLPRPLTKVTMQCVSTCSMSIL